MEGEERRGMVDEERTQCSRGDRFYGIDTEIREIIRQQKEEEWIKEAEEYQKEFQLKTLKRREMDRKKVEEKRRLQREKDIPLEKNANAIMIINETQQRTIDRFWGVENDEKERKQCQTHMALEDLLSRTYARNLKEAILHRKWTNAASLKKENLAIKVKKRERKIQKQYMKMFKASTASDAVLNFRWPTKKAVLSLDDNNQPGIKGYAMDVVYDPNRFSNPKNIFHMANSSSKMDISTRKNAFHLHQNLEVI